MIQRECLVFWVRSRPHRGYSSDRLWEEGVSRGGMDKRSLSERDICTKFITPALRQAGWDEML